MLIRS